MVRVLLGVLIGGSAMFGWGWVYWGILPDKLADADVIRPFEKNDGSAVVQTSLKKDQQATTYVLEKKAGPKGKEKVTHIGMMWLRPAGGESMELKTYAFGYAQLLVSALFLGLILKLASPVLKGYFSRLGFVFVLGVFAAVLMAPGYVIWWRQPLEFSVYNALFYVTAAAIAGLIMAAFIRHEPRKARVPVRIR